MTTRTLFAAAALSTGLLAAHATPAVAADPDVKPAFAFSGLKAVSPELAKAQAEAWLKKVGKFDQVKFDQVWSRKDTVLDRVADSLALGNAEAAAALADLRKPETPAPLAAPAVLKDDKQDAFFRTNLAIAFARGAAAKKAYEEALQALADANAAPESAVDPATLLFFKAAAEHALMKKEEAIASLKRFRNDVPDAPGRYKTLAELMEKDLGTWSPDSKALTNIEKLMDNSGRRLDLSRPGETTQDIQKRIVFRLDEQIKDMENKANGKSQANAGNCPNGGEMDGQQPGNRVPNKPAEDSRVMGGPEGTGDLVDPKVLRKIAENWGSMPPEKRAAVIEEITRDLPPKFKPNIDAYFKNLNRLYPNK